MPEPSWIDDLDEIDRGLYDMDPYHGLTPSQAARLARQRFDAYYVRRPGIPAAPHSLGPAYGIERLRVTARHDDGRPVL